jgi:hypothetical protein
VVERDYYGNDLLSIKIYHLYCKEKESGTYMCVDELNINSERTVEARRRLTGV